jgi:Cu/Ag efflux protein CusF
MHQFRSAWVVAALAVFALALFCVPVLAADAKGKIKSIDAAANRLVITDQGGKDHTFEMGAQAKVRLADKDGKLSDLKVGDEVTVTYQEQGGKNVATSVQRR